MHPTHPSGVWKRVEARRSIHLTKERNAGDLFSQIDTAQFVQNMFISERRSTDRCCFSENLERFPTNEINVPNIVPNLGETALL